MSQETRPILPETVARRWAKYQASRVLEWIYSPTPKGPAPKAVYETLDEAAAVGAAMCNLIEEMRAAANHDQLKLLVRQHRHNVAGCTDARKQWEMQVLMQKTHLEANDLPAHTP